MDDHTTTDGRRGERQTPPRRRSSIEGRGRMILGFAGGFLLATLVGASWAGAGQLQDPAIGQLRQELNNLKISVNNRLVRLEGQLGQHDRDLTEVDRRLRDVEQRQRDTAFLPRRDPPVPVARDLFDVRSLRAESFLLRDDQGAVKATFTLQEGRPVLTLLGDDGREVASLRATAEGAAVLRLRDAAGELRPVALQ